MRGLVNPGGGSGLPPVATDHVALLKSVVRESCRLDPHVPVLVQQLSCAEPGCPPVETVVAILGSPRRTWKFAKPASEVAGTELQIVITDHPEGILHDDHD